MDMGSFRAALAKRLAGVRPPARRVSDIAETAEIATGRRRIISHLLGPVSKAMSGAGRAWALCLVLLMSTVANTSGFAAVSLDEGACPEPAGKGDKNTAYNHDIDASFTSPDGRWVALFDRQLPQNELRILDVQNKTVRIFCHPRPHSIIGVPSYDASSRFLAFHADTNAIGGLSEILILDLQNFEFQSLGFKGTRYKYAAPVSNEDGLAGVLVSENRSRRFLKHRSLLEKSLRDSVGIVLVYYRTDGAVYYFDGTKKFSKFEENKYEVVKSYTEIGAYLGRSYISYWDSNEKSYCVDVRASDPRGVLAKFIDVDEREQFRKASDGFVIRLCWRLLDGVPVESGGVKWTSRSLWGIPGREYRKEKIKELVLQIENWPHSKHLILNTLYSDDDFKAGEGGKNR